MFKLDEMDDSAGMTEVRQVSFKHNQIFLKFKILEDVITKNKCSEYVKD